MLTIARTLMGNPSLLLLDEPSEGLAPRIVEQTIEAIREMKLDGLSLFANRISLSLASSPSASMSLRKAPSALAERRRNSTPGPTCGHISRFEAAGDAAVAVIPGEQMRSPAIQGRQDREEPYVLDEQVGFALRQAQQRHTTIFAAKMIEGLTPTQWAALAKVREVGDCSQNHLGRLTAMDAATIKGVIIA
jgi:hypothetical protein